MSDAHCLAVPQVGIDLWLIATDEVRDPSLLARCHALLSDDETHQQRRFHFERDRHRYLVTRAALRRVLSRYIPADPVQWRFAVNGFGKPHIADEALAARLSFNLSHTEGLILIGVSAQMSVGVDVENVSREISLGVADHFFAPAEANAMRALRHELQPGRFFDLWTLKEAYIKARGMGLSIPLHQFRFELDADPRGVGLSFDAALPDVPSRWHFWQFDVGAHHLGAVCLPATGRWPVVRARQYVPGLAEREIELPMRRTSAVLRGKPQ